MEKRFYLGVCILVFFLLLGLLVSVCIHNVSQPLSQKLEQASQDALDGDLESGIRLSRQAKQDWNRTWHAVALVADHAPMDEIDSLFAQMDVYAAAKDALHFGSYCARLAELVEAVSDAQRLSWWNIL